MRLARFALSVGLCFASAACVVSGAQPPVQAGAGLSDSSGTISVDDTTVPVLPSTCVTGDVVVKTADGWTCQHPPSPVIWHDGPGIQIANDVVSFNPLTVPATDVWPGTMDYSQLTGKPAPTKWSSIAPSVKPADSWPGTMAYSHLTDAPAVSWPTVASTVQRTDIWPGTLNYSQLNGAPAIPPAATWSIVKPTVQKTDAWPGTMDYSQLTNVPADLGQVASDVTTLQNQMATANASIATLNSQVALADDSLGSLSGKVNTADATIATLTTRESGDATAIAKNATAISSLTTKESNDIESLQSTIASLEAIISSQGTQMATFCPVGWSLTTETGFTGVLCEKTVASKTDEMVKVGDYWIDRFEMSTCGSGSMGDASGNGYGVTAIGCSVRNVQPTARITWFQAAQMCANAGKRLCSNQEWQIAVSGTPDPGADGGTTGCNVKANPGTGPSGVPAQTMAHSDCVSAFGAYDMVGNVEEWVSDWHEAGLDWQGGNLADAWPWPSGYGGDTWNINGAAMGNDSQWHNGEPTAAVRGGNWTSGTEAGAFTAYWYFAPSATNGAIGARCCIGG